MRGREWEFLWRYCGWWKQNFSSHLLDKSESANEAEHDGHRNSNAGIPIQVSNQAAEADDSKGSGQDLKASLSQGAGARQLDNRPRAWREGPEWPARIRFKALYSSGGFLRLRLAEVPRPGVEPGTIR